MTSSTNKSNGPLKPRSGKKLKRERYDRVCGLLEVQLEGIREIIRNNPDFALRARCGLNRLVSELALRYPEAPVLERCDDE